MIYLIVHMVVLLLIASGIGAAIGWYYRGALGRDDVAAKAAEDAARLADLRAQRDAAEAQLAAAADKAESAAASRVAEIEAERAKLEARLAELEEEVARLRAAPPPEPAAPPPEPEVEPEPESPAATDGAEPGAVRPIAKPADGGDDLRRIAGVGPKIEALLHDLGIWRYAQIAALTPEEVAWVDERLTFKGRIEREDWIGQAKALAAESEG
ncbi:MAG: hypothetical protein RIM80_27085 [Alphaproteobacteria bacterium]